MSGHMLCFAKYISIVNNYFHKILDFGDISDMPQTRDMSTYVKA